MILKSYGQSEFASDDNLIEEMLLLAGGTVGGAFVNTSLNVDRFALALTRDIQLYDVGKEIGLATNMDSVFCSEASVFRPLAVDDGLAVSTKLEFQKIDKLESLDMIDEHGLVRKRMIQSIDITAELYRSRALIILLWSTVIITIFA